MQEGKPCHVTPPTYPGGRVPGIVTEWKKVPGTEGYYGHVVWVEPGHLAAKVHIEWLHVRHLHQRD